ncbi:MAG: hypothetical protein A2Z12_06795 [Actinobacteria bacterium RBG_16_68_21]|nr:MAG: hypothetical protein A2Z12_06795 [Actinobacteria bacterium RBG_16_68_21]
MTIGQRLWRGVLRVFGWRLVGEFPYPRRFIVIGAPHTSNWDFPLGMLAARGFGLKISFIGKASLFRRPFGWFFRWFGGIPVDRSQPTGVVEQAAAAFDGGIDRILVIAPEGTRSRTDTWRSGFYHIARAAGVAIIPAAIDADRREVRVGAPIESTGDVVADMDRVRVFYEGINGIRPERQGLIRLREEG